MNFLKTTLANSAVFAALTSSALAADDTIKVGVLHSLSGTMAISETTLKDTMLMLIDQQNAKGGLLGKQLEAVVVDPASEAIQELKERSPGNDKTIFFQPDSVGNNIGACPVKLLRVLTLDQGWDDNPSQIVLRIISPAP